MATFYEIITLDIRDFGCREFREKIPSSKPFSQFPLNLSAWEGTRQYMEHKFIAELDLSDYTMIDFKSDGKHVDFYVGYYESQRKGESIQHL